MDSGTLNHSRHSHLFIMVESNEKAKMLTSDSKLIIDKYEHITYNRSSYQTMKSFDFDKRIQVSRASAHLGLNKRAKKQHEEVDAVENISQITFEDKEVERICHEHGVYTYDDAASVTSIKRWFRENTAIETFNELKYFKGLKKIEDKAFYWCERLKSIIIPNGVTSIGSEAFSYSEKLYSVIIPDSVVFIEQMAFCGCISIKKITIPSKVKKIGWCAFGYCDHLEDINIPDNVWNIGQDAFFGCKSLKSIHVPDSVTTIGRDIFGECDSLKTIYISKKNPVVWDRIDSDCRNADLVDPSKMNESHALGLNKRAKKQHEETDAVENIVAIPFEDKEVERICHEHGVYTYDDAREVTSIKEWFEENLKIESFKELKFFTGLKTLDVRSFFDCIRLKEIILPGSIETIGPKAFAGCQSLRSIAITSNVVSIEESCFLGCTTLSSVEIPESVMSIGKFCFLRCSSLRSIVIPSGVTTIKTYTFSGCESLVSVTLPETLESIDREAFYECINLKSIHIPDSVKSVQNSKVSMRPSLFDRCSSLEKIYISRRSPVRGAIEKAYPDVELVDPSDVNEAYSLGLNKRAKRKHSDTSVEDVAESIGLLSVQEFKEQVIQYVESHKIVIRVIEGMNVPERKETITPKLRGVFDKEQARNGVLQSYVEADRISFDFGNVYDITGIDGFSVFIDVENEWFDIEKIGFRCFIDKNKLSMDTFKEVYSKKFHVVSEAIDESNIGLGLNKRAKTIHDNKTASDVAEEIGVLGELEFESEFTKEVESIDLHDYGVEAVCYKVDNIAREFIGVRKIGTSKPISARGTIEFLVDEDTGEIFFRVFMSDLESTAEELNIDGQVENPLTYVNLKKSIEFISDFLVKNMASSKDILFMNESKSRLGLNKRAKTIHGKKTEEDEAEDIGVLDNKMFFETVLKIVKDKYRSEFPVWQMDQQKRVASDKPIDVIYIYNKSYKKNRGFNPGFRMWYDDEDGRFFTYSCSEGGGSAWQKGKREIAIPSLIEDAIDWAVAYSRGETLAPTLDKA